MLSFNIPKKMNSPKTTARIAGLLYLVAILTGILSMRYIPSKIIQWDNASATFNNIKASETLFRLGILSELIGYISFLLLPFVLYRLLRTVNQTYALLMVIFAVVCVPMAFINIGNHFSILTLTSNASYLGAFEENKLQAQVLFYFDSYYNVIKIASIFWGLWLFPFGYLVFKSGFLPKILGILLMFGCFGYLINFIGDFLFPNYGETIMAKFITKPGGIGEIGICVWLLIMGVKDSRQNLANHQ
jgi:Domain of unknown function (DUF4386)